MEEYEQPKKEEEPPRCGRHPSQLLTGICSSCLMERLSSVRDQPEAEISEVGAPEGPGAGKLRKTLMLLFQLDDSSGGGSGFAHPSEGGDPTLVPDSGGGGDRGEGRRKSGSWLRSVLPRRGVRSRTNGGSVKAPSPPPQQEEALDPRGGGGGGGGPSSRCFGSGNSDGRGADVRVERKISFRRSSDWRVGWDQSKSSVEPHRHSWDGAMVGRAFACSFACLEDPTDTARTVRRSNVEEMVGETRGGVAESRTGGHHSVHEGQRIRARGCGDAGLEMAVSGVGRRRSNRWSRVWDRSIRSPLKEFVRKGEHVLDRSLSESRREIRRGKNAEAADISGGIQPGRSNGHVSGRVSQGTTRSSQATSIGAVQNFRADWLKNKECKIGRSRSVHYTSPGNLDNGMLRFYLTPMRSNRTTNRARRRNSSLFGRGLFGFI